ncbi:MAG: Rad2 nuclease [Trizodia sp. TS-e1964]|nr:MAG: Rad2 nuclease [Trizodia sp. TS-e1964]
MGISGLLPLLKSIHRARNLNHFSGQTIGIDAYGWLHRGTVACAIDLALDKPTTKYVEFAMGRIKMLQHFGVVPYVVFDGDYLPSKAATEASRARRREETRVLGLSLYRSGKISQAHAELQKAIDVTPEMARLFIEELKIAGVQYIVAPYEADSQLAYLERKGFISAVLSEDSDLLVFGTNCLLTKLDKHGDCIEINRADFAACKDISLVGWTDTEFRRMAILSGCDYLPNINKMGLKTAYSLVRKYKTIERIIKFLQFDGHYKVPSGYQEAFIRAELTFLHQRVFCPSEQAVVMNTKPDNNVNEADLTFIGDAVDAEIAVGVACGDLHPMTKKPIVFKSRSSQLPCTPGAMTRKASGSRQQASSICSKPIKNFFKPKRVPLAELDPNSFTPSPSQQRLLHQTSSVASQTDIITPIALQRLTGSGRSPMTPPASAESQTRAGGNSSSNLALPGGRPFKRPRLCSVGLPISPADSIGNVQLEKSPFFGSSADFRGILTTVCKTKQKDITIFSDDSIEEAMTNLAELNDLWKPSKQRSLKVYQDPSPKKPPTPASSLNKRLLSSKHTKNSDMSGLLAVMETPPKSAAPLRVLDRQVGLDIVSKISSFVDQGSLPQTSTCCFADSTLEPEIYQEQNLGLSVDPKSPAQELQCRNKMEDFSYNKSEHETGTLEANITRPSPLTPPSALFGQWAYKGHAPSLSRDESPKKSISAYLRGSEDWVILDSEGEQDGEVSPIQERVAAKLDLGRFAFTQ